MDFRKLVMHLSKEEGREFKKLQDDYGNRQSGNCLFNQLNRRPLTKMFRQEAKKSECDKNLMKKRQKMLLTLDNCLQQWKELQDEEVRFKNEIAMLNQHTITQQQKRERCTILLDHNKKIIKERNDWIKNISQEIVWMKKVAKKMNIHINKHLIYQRYLEEVQALQPGFRSVLDVILRFLDLQSCRTDVSEEADKKIQCLNKNAASLTRMFERKHSEMVSLSRELMIAQMKYDESRRRTSHVERVVLFIREEAAALMCDRVRTLGSAANIYERHCVKMQQKPKEIELEKWWDIVSKEIFTINTMAEKFEEQRILAMIKKPNRWRQAFLRLMI